MWKLSVRKMLRFSSKQEYPTSFIYLAVHCVHVVYEANIGPVFLIAKLVLSEIQKKNKKRKTGEGSGYKEE